MKPIIKIFNQRLLRLANCLETLEEHPNQGQIKEINLVAIERNSRILYVMKYPTWILDTMIFLEPINQEEGLIEGVIDYYNLTQDEFCHIMDVEGFQLIERFGGKVLTMDATPADIAFNIRELVKRKGGYNE